MNCADVPSLRLAQRLRLRLAEAVEDVALSAIPRGALRKQLLEQVDRVLRLSSPRHDDCKVTWESRGAQ